jgi:hypothetical protein
VKQFKTIIINFLLITFILSSCSQKAAPFRAEVSFITGTLKINNIEASAGNTVVKDDMLKTGIKSEATIQITDTAVITMKPETELRFENILRNNDDSRSVSMELNKGKTLHNVLKKGTDYSVKAPTAVASVRGTVFEVSETGSKTFIAVEAGTVSVKKLSGKIKKNQKLTEGQKNGTEEIILTAGQSLELHSPQHTYTEAKKPAAARIPVRKSTTEKIANAQRIDKKNTIKNIRKEIIREDKSAIADETEERTPQNIDRITLYSGEVITGTIMERGETYSILTADGVIKVSRKDIRNNEIVK